MPQALTARETIYYDGVCGLCHRFVQFVMARDQQEQFDFLPLSRMSEAERSGLPDSVVVRPAGEDRKLVKSEAALHVFGKLGGIWGVFAIAGRLFPRRLRDWVYDRIAANRYALFGKHDHEVCLLRPPGKQGS